ncbi:MAG: universal stress protein [Deltaproteobacteria bacterium]|jgi:nucleotide-binding universal stress UspA family protein|nr:universal stress protein [Deltaproteobacteria bacterium]
MKILVPVDGSEHSLKALEVAADYAKMKEAQIYVISVAAAIGGIEDHEIPPRMLQSQEEHVKEFADKAIKTAREFMVKEQVKPGFSEIVTTMLSVPDAIIDFAKTEKIDLIIMGSRGLGTSSIFKIGSIANQVVKHSHCSVYLVKPRGGQG